jgi:hypothetical protein
MNKTKADILYESLANFTDEEGAIECGAKMRDYARELEHDLNEQVVCNGKGAEREAALLGKVERIERDNARLTWLIRQVTTDLPTNRDWLNPDYEREMRSVSALPNVQAQR